MSLKFKIIVINIHPNYNNWYLNDMKKYTIKQTNKYAKKEVRIIFSLFGGFYDPGLQGARWRKTTTGSRRSRCW